MSDTPKLSALLKWFVATGNIKEVVSNKDLVFLHARRFPGKPSVNNAANNQLYTKVSKLLGHILTGLIYNLSCLAQDEGNNC